MSKNILIIGPQRCGKTSITNYISNNFFQYESYRVDATIIALTSLFMKKTVVQEKPHTVELDNVLTEDKIRKFLVALCKEIQYDLKPLNKKLILDTFELDVKEAKENFGNDFDIYCLGMPNETVQNLMINIRLNDTVYDWTSELGQFRLKLVCDNIIERSKILQRECEKYNITFFDTSGNRKEKIKLAIEEIKKKSIID